MITALPLLTMKMASLRPALFSPSESGRSLEIQITAPGAYPVYEATGRQKARLLIYKPQAGLHLKSESFIQIVLRRWPQPTRTPGSLTARKLFIGAFKNLASQH